MNIPKPRNCDNISTLRIGLQKVHGVLTMLKLSDWSKVPLIAQPVFNNCKPVC